MNNIKRHLSFVLAVLILAIAIPVGDFVAFAAVGDADNGGVKVTGVDISVNYRGPNIIPDIAIVRIKGNNLVKNGEENLNVGFIGSGVEGTVDSEDENVELSTKAGRLEYRLPVKYIGTLIIGEKDIDISFKDMPIIQDVEPKNNIDENYEGQIYIDGNNFKKIKDNEYITGNIRIPSLGIEKDLESELKWDDHINLTQLLKDYIGQFSIDFKKKLNKDGIDINHTRTYSNIITKYKKLDVPENMQMIPSQGPLGQEVQIIGNGIPDKEDLSAFFVKELNDPLTLNHMSKKENSSVIDEKNVYTIEVPESLKEVYKNTTGPYYVILTNDIGSELEADVKNISSRHVMDQKFRVQSAGDGMVLEEIKDDNDSTLGGKEVTIYGKNIGSLSSTIHKNENQPNIEVVDDKLIITYEEGGSYGQPGSRKKYKKLIKTIEVSIGGQKAELNKDEDKHSISTDQDEIKIIVPPIKSNSEDMQQIVVVDTTTEVIYENVGEEFTEQAELKKKFTYTPSSYEPKISEVIPGKIPVNKDGGTYPVDLKYSADKSGLKLTIIGEDFSLYRYKDSNGKDVIKYPVINIGQEVVLDKNVDSNLDFRVYDQNGKLLDGTEEGSLGVKIVVDISKSVFTENDWENKKIDLVLRNPLNNNSEVSLENGVIKGLGIPVSTKVELVLNKESNKPLISEVVPNVIDTEGGKVTIKGSNFNPGVKLYLDGEEREHTRNLQGTELVFQAPEKKEGTYQILVINRDGEADIAELVYTSESVEVELTNFNPKEGSEGTLVTVSGQGFVRPGNNKVTDTSGVGIYRLIGTRVMLNEGQDVNDYNRDDNGRIKLDPVEMTDLIKGENGFIQLHEDYRSIILKEKDEDNYFSIYQDPQTGNKILTDGGNDRYILEVNEDGKIIGNKAGKAYSIDVGKDHLILEDERKLQFNTPYEKNSKDEIIGHRVQIVNDQELIFKVPKKDVAQDTYHDLILVNPGQSRSSMEDESGFLYLKENENETLEVVTPFKPEIGSVEGGQTVTIEGGQFIREQSGRTIKVYVGDKLVPLEDIKILENGTKMEIKTPKYDGDYDEVKANNGKRVPIVINNPNKTTNSDGWHIYVIAQDIEIERIIDNQASATDDEIVIIEGSGFKFDESSKLKEKNPKGYEDFNKNGENDDLRYWINDANKENYNELKEDWKKLVEPILPKVYFGEKKATIVEYKEGDREEPFGARYIKVKVPKSTEENVMVYVRNNDGGISNELPFKYLIRNPEFENINIDKGIQRGGDPREIHGKNFIESSIKIISSSTESVNKTQQLVRFGNMNNPKNSNIEVPKRNPEDQSKNDDYGEIQTNRKTTVRVGNLRVSYDDINTLEIEYIKSDSDLESNEVFKFEKFKKVEEKETKNEIYFPMKKFKDYEGNELVKVYIKEENGERRLVVERGYAESATTVDKGAKINVITPTAQEQGLVDVTVVNPDGREAVGLDAYLYRDSQSNPSINDVLRNDREVETITDADGNEKKTIDMNIKGGTKLTIKGSGFRYPIQLSIGGERIVADIEYKDKINETYQTLEFEMPDMSSLQLGVEYPIFLEDNYDGTATTLESNPKIFVKFTEGTSNPTVTNIIPNVGPTSGGTEVEIIGTDFREFMEEDYPGERIEIKFGDKIVPKEDIISVDLEKITLKTPVNTPGSVDVRITNPDGEFVTLLDGFTYVSNPLIDKIVDPENDKSLINNISIDGGDLIKIKGSDFMDGAKVIFNPDLRLLADNETEASIEGELVVINGKRFELNYDGDKEVTAAKQDDGEGQDTYIEFIDGQNLIVKTPAGSIGDNGVIVINPDGAVSNLYNIEYGIPEIGAPMDVQAELVYDQFIRIKWSGVSAANEYEIYVKIEDGDYQFVGSTTETSYAYENIESRTKYRFMVKAIGEYGSSKPLEESESNSVTTGRDAGPEDIDGELGEYTDIDRQGENANITIGTRDFGSEGYTIDLTRGELAGAKKLSIRIPAEIVSGYGSGEIRILGPDYSMKFRPEVFRNTRIDENKNNNAGVVFNIQPYKGPKGSSTGSIVSGPIYDLNAKVFVGMNGTDVDRLAGGIDLVLDDNPMITQSRRLRNLSLSRYYEAGNNWVNTMRVDRMALYAITGSRR